jgi:para-aminobenzoate synthetase/4-amino-4-deoxychorismate lyase
VELGGYENSVVLHDVRNQQWLLFRRPVRIHAAHSLESVQSVLRTVEDQVKDNRLHAAGFVAYEAAPAFDPAFVVKSPDTFPLAWFGVYQEPEQIAFPGMPKVFPEDIPWQLSVSESEYRSSIDKIKKYIRAGDTYQVNYSFRLRAPFCADPWRLFVRMIHAQGYGYGAFVNTEDWTICSASPELFFQREDRRLTSRPMKGTVSRGLRQTDDLEKAAWLQDSKKNRAENAMIVDMVRNDMGRVADIGSVQVTDLFAAEKYPTLWQMTSTVQCTTDVGVTGILRAMFPAASITGAPKARTMQIIAELENAPRRIYTGTIGFLSPQHSAQFNVAIRTVLLDRRNNLAEYGVGGGIVWDSKKGDELQECYTKARVLTHTTPDFALLETILWTPEDGYYLLDYHLDRIADSAAYFSRPIDIPTIRRKLAALERQLPSGRHRIRLLVPRENEPVLEPHLLTPSPQPYRVHLAKRPVRSSDPFLYHKTTHRQVYEQAMAESRGSHDVLLWNEKNEVTESCIANVVVEMDGKLLTPPVTCGLLPGVYRSLLLEQDAIREQTIRVADLHRCSRIFLINSVRRMWEISLVLGKGEKPMQMMPCR